MTDTTDPTAGDEESPRDAPPLPDGDDPREEVEAYETEEGVVLYDSQNPLAWLKATNAVSPGDRL